MIEIENCLYLKGEQQIVEHFLKMDRILMIVGKGFDPRACTAIKIFKENSINVQCAWLIDYTSNIQFEDEKINISRSKNNSDLFKEVCEDIQNQILKIPAYKNDEGKRTLIISESVRILGNEISIDEYNNIIIDISAMPRTVSFSIINRIESIKNNNQKLYIVVTENSDYDDNIRPVIVEDSAEYLQGFNTFSLTMESDEDDTIWLPILGVNAVNAFKIIDNYLKPIEICPVVPFPSSDIKRSENILREYGQTLFREKNIEKRNIIYVPEKYPLIVYRKLYDTIRYYEKALNDDKNRMIRYAFSSQSSKLIDIGMLLAVIKLRTEGIKVGVVTVENRGYVDNRKYNKSNEKIYCISLDDSEFDW